MRRYRLPLIVALLACVAAPAGASADSRVTAQIQGPSTVQRGQEAVYTVTIRNAGTQTLGPGSPRLAVDLDAIPSSSALLSDATFLGGTGRWACGSSGCTLAGGQTFPAKATAAFSIRAKVLGSVTLDFDVTGNEVLFSNVRKSVRTSGTLLPVLYGVLVPPTVSPRTGPIGLTLSERSQTIVRLERITSRYRLSRRVRTTRGRFRRVQSLRCAERRPRVRRTTRVRKLRSRCGLGLRTLGTTPARPRGFNLIDIPQLRALPAGHRYRLRLVPRTPDGRVGRQAYSPVVKSTG
jgi:hypothetical protein